MMRTASLLLFASSLLAGCGQEAVSTPKAEPTQVKVPALDEFCARGGMEAAKDPRCKAAADERFRKFMDGGGDDGPERR